MSVKPVTIELSDFPIEDAFRMLHKAGYSTVRIVAARIGGDGEVVLADELRDERKLSHAFSAKVWERFGA